MIPIYQREAMWMSFDTDEPAALQVGIGKVCAISGDPWNETLTPLATTASHSASPIPSTPPKRCQRHRGRPVRRCVRD